MNGELRGEVEGVDGDGFRGWVDEVGGEGLYNYGAYVSVYTCM